jgi:hypothetical protein
MDKIIFNVPYKLKKEFQIKVIKENKDMTMVLVSLIKQYLGK